ncbi:MAG: hypothetical protein JSV44_01255 [Candidatus Zixiibacteriota bacterium]|nr:MAG: hypothetical protein JSV44_01255 [candidate division Zixibacteria bacterium]
MEAIIAAVITAIASITVALIQANSAQKQARILREKAAKTLTDATTGTAGVEAEPVRPEPETHEPSAAPPPDKTIIGRFSRVWWIIGAILAVEVLIFGIVNEDWTPIVNSLFLIPLATLLLSFFRPVFWGYAAFFVTLLQGVAMLGYTLGGGQFYEGDFSFLAILFIANAGLCALVSFLMLRRKLKL